MRHLLRRTIVLLAAVGLAGSAGATPVTGQAGAGVRVAPNGIYTEGAVGEVPLDGSGDGVTRIDFLDFDFDFRPIGGGTVGQGSLQDALDRQHPGTVPTDQELLAQWEQFKMDFREATGGAFDLEDVFPEARDNFFGVAANPDPWLAINVAYQTPDGTNTDPVYFTHFSSTDIAPLPRVARTHVILGLLVEDGNGDGSALAQSFVSAFLPGLTGAFPAGDIFLSEPGFEIMAWEGGPIVPDMGMLIDELAMNVDTIVTPGDRFATFAGVVLIPEPARLALLALGIAGLLRARRGLPS